ncbi:Type IV inositol polyphosphate 5-phosphatase 7 [Orobanche gracilis]
MKDENSKKIKLSWSKQLFRKMFNLNCKREDVEANEAVYDGGDMRWSNSYSEREPPAVKKSKTEKSTKNFERSFSRSRSHSRRRGRGYLDHPQVINIQNYSLFVSTWNVGGKSPSSNMKLDDWLHSAPPADIYVLGFQEIVPLNAGNILVAEDNGPAKKWLSLIKRTLNNAPGTSGYSGRYTPSPVLDPVTEWNSDFEESTSHKASTFFPRRSFQTPQNWRTENDISVPQPRLERRFSVCDRVFFGRRPSDYDPSTKSGYRPSDCSSSHRPSDYSSGTRASDYSSSRRPSDYSWGQRASDFSRWGSEEDYHPGDSPSTVLYSPMSNGTYAPGEDVSVLPGGYSKYSLVASKQMVGIFLTIWVRSELKEHVGNIKVSCVGRGLMGYLGNKGSISISMLLHQTSLCFVCSHLTSGQKEGDELRRNADFIEILRKTRFPRVNGRNEKSPETILEHDRIIWLGDLNYRIALPYRSAKALIEMQNWRALLDKDQLRIEQRRGRVFDGWKEGKIYFPPTYKYSHNSDRYAGDDMHPKEKRRTPAWCDRILWYGNGLQQSSYIRGEYRLRKSMSCSGSRIEVDELLPYSHAYTELCFF